MNYIKYLDALSNPIFRLKREFERFGIEEVDTITDNCQMTEEDGVISVRIDDRTLVLEFDDEGKQIKASIK